MGPVTAVTEWGIGLNGRTFCGGGDLPDDGVWWYLEGLAVVQQLNGLGSSTICVGGARQVDHAHEHGQRGDGANLQQRGGGVAGRGAGMRARRWRLASLSISLAAGRRPCQNEGARQTVSPVPVGVDRYLVP